MDKLFNIINIPLGWILRFIAGAFGGNFAVAVFIFTLLINVLFIPLTIKSQKSMVQQTRIKPKLDELKKKYGDDRQKFATAQQQLFQEEGIGMGGGCLPMILRLVIMMSIYYLIMQPLTYLMSVDADVIKTATEALNLGKNPTGNVQLSIISAVQNGKINAPEISKVLDMVNFNFFGINLTETPKFSINIFGDFKPIWIMPILAFSAQMLSSFASLKLQKKTNPDAPNMSFMLLTMPLISLVIGFSLPGGVTFYWACSSIIGGFAQILVQTIYGPHKMLARERNKEIMKQYDFEALQLKKINKDEINI